MGEDRHSHAPRHPRLGRRSLVLWTGTGSGLDAARLERDAVGAVALPLRHAPSEAALVARARDAGLGVVLPGQAWLNQLAPERRGAGFDALPYAQPRALRVEHERMSPAALADYADAFLDAQLAAGATLACTPAHVFGQELGAGRAQDLALAAAAIAVWRERQAWRPPPQQPGGEPRELHACLAVKGEHLAAAAPALVERYAALEVDGFWLTIVNGDGSAPQLAGAAELALGLQEASGRPVTVSGAGAPHLALLASGVAATCAGPLAAGPVFPPRAADADGVVRIAAPVFHPAILGTVEPGAAGEEARTALFATEPCRCGAHRSFEPPRGRRETAAHNRWCLLAEVRDATRLAPPLDEARLAARITRAARTRRRLGLSELPTGWTAVAATARAHRAVAAAGALAADA
jgi:hypothetical protein